MAELMVAGSAAGLDSTTVAQLVASLVAETAGSMVEMLGWKMVEYWDVM